MNEDWDPKTQSREEGILVRRSPEEERSFQRAFKGLQWLYLHAETYGVILQEVPEDAPQSHPVLEARMASDGVHGAGALPADLNDRLGQQG